MYHESCGSGCPLSIDINDASIISKKKIPNVKAQVMLILGRYIVEIKKPRILAIKKEVDNEA